MPTILQHRRGTAAQNNNYAGSAGELTIDTDLNTIRVHDGGTMGGNVLVTAVGTQTLTNKTLTSPTITGAALTVASAPTPTSNASINLGSTSAWFNNVYGVTFIGVSTTAKYADLAENYQADSAYDPGTVVVFGGKNEVTQSTTDHDTAIAGVVSTAPAYLMNSELQNDTAVSVALAGRVPCRVQGPVSKGTVLVSGSAAGTAQAIDNTKFAPGCIIGKAMEAIADDSIQTIEISVGRS